MATHATDTAPRRRRRSPESAEREIFAAAESFLRERPFHEMTVDEVMARTTLSRPSFYVYFRDRNDLVIRLVNEVGAEVFAMAERWLKGSGDPRTEVRDALEGVAAVWSEHGLLLGAMADAGKHDEEVDTAYEALLGRFIDATAEHIEDDIKAGLIEPLAPRETARALVLMTERYLVATFGHDPQAPTETVVETLWTLWVRALYGSPRT
jgi:TetR/AcrR family transcriptional regulator, ethionamide resistance regulator